MHQIHLIGSAAEPHLLEILGDSGVVFVERSCRGEQGREVKAAALVVQHIRIDLQLVHAANHFLDRAEPELGHRLPGASKRTPG